MKSNMELDVGKLESVLYAAGAPITKKKLCEILKCNSEELEKGSAAFIAQAADRGVTLVDSGSHLALVTHPKFAEVIEEFKKVDISPDLSRAAQETLSIIAYLGPVSKVDLDFLRGVNTQYTLRRLAMRGLIREVKEGRSKKLSVTVDFLTHLGISRTEELPEYEATRTSIQESLQRIQKRLNESE